MGEVFLAEDLLLERRVALKFLPDSLQEDPVARERFQREAKSAAALDHPFICKVYEICEVNGKTCIAMEYVVGSSLESKLAQGPLPLIEAIEIAKEIAEAFEEAHNRRFVHRDLKPANIMLTEQGHVKVMDFGLAKRFSNTQTLDGQEQTILGLTQAGTRVGTPAYMSPEQVLGGEIDGRSDIFSFGIIFYELVVGTHPFRRATPSETLAAILRDPPASPTSRPSEDWPVLRVLLGKLMAKEVARRPQTFQEVRQDLRGLAGALAARKPTADDAVSTGQVPGVEGETRCVGRETERAELQRVLDRAVGGKGALVLIGGELGIGKTRLAEELLQAARQRDCLVLTGRCHEMDGTPPFILFVEALEQACRTLPPSTFRDALADAAPEVAKLLPEFDRLFPDIPSPASLPAEHQRRFLFNSVYEFLDRLSRVTPLVLLLDDLHWADESTLLLLHHLAQRLSEMSMLVLATPTVTRRPRGIGRSPRRSRR